jgi:uncharacterized membrane protein YgcG
MTTPDPRRTGRVLVRTGGALVAACTSVVLFATTASADPEIIPKPNSGQAPQSPGDPGGWLQISLFFLLCAVVIGIALGVWWSSRRARERRKEAGLDPVTLARARGEGIRRHGETAITSGGADSGGGAHSGGGSATADGPVTTGSAGSAQNPE